MSTLFDSPFVVPVAGCVMILGFGVASIFSDMRKRELHSHERMAMLNRGASIDEIEAYVSRTEEAAQQAGPVRDPLRSLGRARRTATVLLSCGVGIILFGLMLYAIFLERGTLVISAIGVVDLAIGFGFLIDYRMQARELARFGMEVETESLKLRERRD